MYFEPVRKYTENEEKRGKTEQHDSGQDAGRVPYLTCLGGDEIVLGQAEAKEASSHCGHIQEM